MDRLLTINGRSYKAAEFDLNLLCDFEDAGIALEKIDSKMFNVIRQYAASTMNMDVKAAGAEISEHMRNGGSLEDIADVMSEMMNDSGFFRKKQTDKTTGDTKRTRKTRQKSESEDVTL